MIHALLLAALLPLQDTKDKPKEYATTKEAIQAIQIMVGEWKGNGDPRDSEGLKHWSETFGVNMKIDREKDFFQLEIEVKDGVFWKTALIGYDLKKKHYTCEAVLVKDGAKRSYVGVHTPSNKELNFDEVTENWPRERVTFSLNHKARILVEFQTQAGKGKDLTSLGLVGLTKEGFVKGQGPTCIVTGGGGSIAVEYKGKTYYVC